MMINRSDSCNDVLRCDESFDTSRSNGEATLIGRNSLFQYSDDTSIQKYISQFHQEKADHTSNQEASNQYTLYDEDFSIKFNNLSEWKVPNDTDSGKSIVFNLIKNISYRERLLDRIKQLITLLDTCYWKYCVERMKLLQANDVEDKSNLVVLLSNQLLVLQRNAIFSLQNSLSVGISHLRSISVEIIQSVTELRVIIQKQFAISEDIPSIFWRNQNYLIKMLTDVRFLFDWQSPRYWIGFLPNSLLVPPQSHNPFDTWKANICVLMKQFLLNYKDKQTKDSRRSGKQNKRHFPSDKRSTSETMQLHGEREILSTPLIPTDFGDSSVYDHSSSIHSYKSTETLEEWEQLRDYCAFSWGKVSHENTEKPWPFIRNSGGIANYTSSSETDDEDMRMGQNTIWVQSMEISPYFWNNGNQNPFVVEAALGLEEVFPKVYIVPPLPKDLLAKCLRLSAVLDAEAYYVRKRNRKIPHIQQKTSIEPTAEPKNLHQQLKVRQQGSSANLRGISSQMNVMFSSFQVFPNYALGYGSGVTGDNFRSSAPYSKLETHSFKPFRLETGRPSGRTVLKSLKKDYVTQQTRVLSRIDEKFFSFHASQIQRMIRGCLGRKFVFQLKQELQWKIAVLQLQSLCRGFLARLKTHRRKRELRVVAFLARKGAINAYRAAVVITHFIRDAANRNRTARGEVQLFQHKIEMRGNSVLKKSMYVNDEDTKLISLTKPSLSRSATMISNFSDISIDDRNNGDKTFEEGELITQSNIELPQSCVESFRSTNSQLFSKNMPDSIRHCRLIPLHSSGKASNPNNSKRHRKMLSGKEYTFLPSGTGSNGYSATYDVYIPPPCYERNFKSCRKKDADNIGQVSQKLKEEKEYEKLSSLLKASIIQ